MDLVRLPDCCPLPQLKCVIVGQNSATVSLAVYGEIDLDNADHLSHVISAAGNAAGRQVIVDINGVTFLGAAGAAALLQEHTRAETAGHQLTLRRPRPLVHRVLEITGLLDAFGLPSPPAQAFPQRPTWYREHLPDPPRRTAAAPNPPAARPLNRTRQEHDALS